MLGPRSSSFRGFILMAVVQSVPCVLRSWQKKMSCLKKLKKNVKFNNGQKRRNCDLELAKNCQSWRLYLKFTLGLAVEMHSRPWLLPFWRKGGEGVGIFWDNFGLSPQNTWSTSP